MSVISLIPETIGQVGINPRIVKMVSSDIFATITAENYLLNYLPQLLPSDILAVTYSDGTETGVASGFFILTISGGDITMSALGEAGSVTLPVSVGHMAVFTNTDGAFGDDAATAINGGNIQAGVSGTAGYLASFPGTAAKGSLRVTAVANTGDTVTTLSNSAMGQATVISFPDPGASTANVVLDVKAGGQSVSSATASATPGTIRAFKGLMTGSNATQTSGNLVGVRGEVDMVGASGGFVYGVQGKVIPTGTLSGSTWVAGLFGQFDLQSSTVNAAQLAAIWGDWGATGATATDLTGCRGVAFTNTTSNVLNAQDYRYGNATNLLELAGAGGTLNYYAAAGTSAGSAGNSTHCAAQQVIKISVNGTACYIPIFTQNT